MPRRSVHLLIVWAMAASGAPLPAANPPSVNLLHPDRLAGWDLLPSKGWRVRAGELHADADATPLAAGWTFSDFELAFRWSANKPGRLKLSLTDVRRESAGTELLTLSLSEGENCGILTHDGKPLANGRSVETSVNGWHLARLRRRAGEMSLTVDDQPFYRVATSVAERLGLRFAVDGGPVALAEIRVVEPAGEAIFNGRDLAGWWTPGNRDSWIVEGADLVCLNKDGNYLRTEREFGNFVLSFEYRMPQGGNSGIGIRTPRAGWPSGDGMELQLLDEPTTALLTRHSTMAIYGNLEPLARSDRSRQWNQVVIRAEDRVISAWVNGELVQFADTAKLPELRRRHLKGWIGLQDHGARIEFRDLKVLEISDGIGPVLGAEKASEPSQWVLERLMTPQRLAIDDGLGSRTIHKSIMRPGEHVLAELAGPGAVVEFSHCGASSQLAFYFDGEAKPRVDCAAADLYLHAPQVGQDQQPLLTYLPFRRSLKIVATVKDTAEYRLDYVVFPADAPMETFQGGESGVARGLLPALSYRNEQLGWGTHREADPLPRKSSQPQTITPGETQEMLRLEGAGIVEWTKLQAHAGVLTNDDLWLEVRYGNQPRPAMAAPVRYLFPGLAGGNYPNYAVVDRGGFTSMLALPYRDSLSISLVNQGKQTLNSVVVTVSYEPSTGDSSEGAPPFVLHGVFARGDSRDPVKLTGHGRLVGLLRQWKADALSPLDTLVVDEARDGSQAVDWGCAAGTSDAPIEFRRSLTGRFGGLAWRYFWLVPIDFTESLELRTDGGTTTGDRLVLAYLRD